MHRIDLGRQDLEVLPPFFALTSPINFLQNYCRLIAALLNLTMRSIIFCVTSRYVTQNFSKGYELCDSDKGPQ